MRRAAAKARKVLPRLAAILAFSLSLAVAGQSQNAPQLRTVHGVVEDKSEAPVGAAVIYLKNNRTQSITTHISEDNGQYRFSGLDPNADYEIHAEHDNLMSGTRTVSSFDGRKDFEITLKLDREKKK